MIKILSLDQNPNFLHFSLGMLEGCRFTPEQINQAACDIAKQVLGQDIVSKRTMHNLEFLLRSMAFLCFVNNACTFFFQGCQRKRNPGGWRYHPNQGVHIPGGCVSIYKITQLRRYLAFMIILSKYYKIE